MPRNGREGLAPKPVNNETDPPARKPEIQAPANQQSEKKQRLIAEIEMMARVRFSGPLPPPDLLARYNEIIPNGAERIFAMAENQARHREKLETKVIEGNVSTQREGSWFAFILTLVALIGGMFLIYVVKNVSGLVAIIAALVSLASVFFFSKYEQRKERTEKSTSLERRRHDTQPPDKAES